MSTQEEKLAFVGVCVGQYADVETGAEALKAGIDTLIAGINGAYGAGVGRQGEHLRIVNTLEAARGDVASAIARVIAAHEKCTAIAKREGCDVVLPDAFAITGGVTIQGGTGR